MIRPLMLMHPRGHDTGGLERLQDLEPRWRAEIEHETPSPRSLARMRYGALAPLEGFVTA